LIPGVGLGENLVRTGLYFALFLLYFCLGLGENLVRTGLDFALFLLFYGSGVALFGLFC
jgi:hypothetical protein